MRALPLREEDYQLFNSQVDRALYMVYRDDVENFTVMFEEQGPGYWLKLCITLRSFMQTQGYDINMAATDLNHFDEYFIFLAKLFTGGNVESLHTYVKDVVSVSRFHQLMYNIPNAFVSKESHLTPSFKRLFGIPSDAKNIVKMVGTLPLHLRAVGTLLNLLARWPKAQKKAKSYWKVPDSWQYGNYRKASHFEVFLKNHWGDKLLTFINVKVSDISWWKTLPKGEGINIIEERTTALGRCISKTSRELNLPIVGSIAVLQDPLLYCKFFNTAPRGKFIFFWNQASAQIFIFDTFRELYYVDTKAAMHPFSQIVISFTNAAFNREFIFGGEGMETQLHNLRDRELASQPPHEIQKRRQTINFLLKILANHTIKADMAIHLNANFHSSLLREIDWIDPIILSRFLWNIPLILNWLENLLIKIYEFQRHFIPVCHFPVRKKIVSSVEMLYRRMLEATFLTKTCIIIVEAIMRREHREAGRCSEARHLIRSLVGVLTGHKSFLEEDAYRVLDGILKTGWNEDEREDGECCPLIEDRIKLDLCKLNTVPDIDSYFSENFRHIYYWVSNEVWPDIEGSVQYYSEAMEMLKDYKVGSRQPYKEMREPYNFTKFRDFIKDLNFTQQYSTETGEKMGFASLVIRLLEEDGWLCSGSEEKFWFHFNVHFNLGLRHIDDEGSLRGGLPDNALAYLEFIQKHGSAYYLTACVLGDTWKSEIAGQNALAQIHRRESLANLADLGARISSHIQQLNRKITACPPPQYFTEAIETAENIAEIKKTISIEKMKSLIEVYGKFNVTFINVDIATTTVLQPISFPKLEDMQSSDVGFKWLAYVERRRDEFLQLVSEIQFELIKSVAKKHVYSAVCLFPEYDILEHRLYEEMAAMQKCLELGGMFYGAAYGLCRLITHRFHYLQECFITWRKKPIEFVKPYIPKSTSAVLESLITIRIDMLATFIPLQALFLTYISQYKTTHPLTEMTIEMLFDWADSARIWCTEDKTNMIGNCLGDYVRALQTMGCDYMKTLLVHCKKVWVVTPFISNPLVETSVGSVDHVQQILSVFTQLFLMSFYTILTRIPQQKSYMKLADTLTNEIIHLRMRLRKAELEDQYIFETTWPNSRQSLKAEFRSIWSNLLEFRKFLCGTVPSKPFPQWYDNNNLPIWKEYFSIFVSSHYKNILLKISFSDFINTPNPDSDSVTKMESKPNKKKGETKTSPIKEIAVEESKRKKNNKDNSSVEPLIYQLNITQIESKDDCLIVSREMAVIQRYEKQEIEDLSLKEKIKHNTQAGKKEKLSNGDKAKGKRKTEDLQYKAVKQEHQIDEEGELLVNHKNSEKFRGDDENVVANKLKTCMYCKNVEPTKKTYKKCALCKKEGWLQPRFYCSPNCQVKDWKERHNMEHKSGIQELI